MVESNGLFRRPVRDLFLYFQFHFRLIQVSDIREEDE